MKKATGCLFLMLIISLLPIACLMSDGPPKTLDSEEVFIMAKILEYRTAAISAEFKIAGVTFIEDFDTGPALRAYYEKDMPMTSGFTDAIGVTVNFLIKEYYHLEKCGIMAVYIGERCVLYKYPGVAETENMIAKIRRERGMKSENGKTHNRRIQPEQP